MSARRLLLWTAAALVLLVSGYFAYKNYFEWVEVEIESPMSVQARKHDMLAASRYLQQLGYQTEHIEDSDFFSVLSPWITTIVLQELPESLPADSYERLLYWVEQGGHLVIGLDSSGHSEAEVSFFASFGLTVTHDFDNTADSYTLVVDGSELVGRMSAHMELDQLFTLWPHTPVSLNSRLQELFAFAKIKHGDGHVTAVADSGLWGNESIGLEDNARLLAAAISGWNNTAAGATIYISDTNTSLPGVFTLLWQQWRWFCLVMIALGLALLRQSWVRFGPIHRETETRSNNFARHLLAVAQFQGRYQSCDRLLSPARQRVLSQYSDKRIGGSGVTDSADLHAGNPVAANDDLASVNQSRHGSLHGSLHGSRRESRGGAQNKSQPDSQSIHNPTMPVAVQLTTDRPELLERVHRASGIAVKTIDKALFESANKATILPIVSTLQAIDRRVENNAE